VLLVKVVEVEETLRPLVVVWLVDLVVVLVDLVLLIPLDQEQATQQVRELHTAIQVDRKVEVLRPLDTMVEAAVVPVVLHKVVGNGVRQHKVVVDKDVMLLIYLMLVMVELELLGLDGLLPMLDQQDLVLVVVQVHIILLLLLVDLVDKVVVALVPLEDQLPMMQAFLQWVPKDTQVETTGVLVEAVVKEMELVGVMVVMELLLLHMMQHQQLSAQEELPQLKK
jgi:hypothetical protein